DPYGAGPPEGCLIYRIVPSHGTGVGMGRPCTLCKSPRLQNDDRFAAGESPGRTHEFSRVAHALHIDQNAPGSLVISQEVDHVAKVDIDHGAERGKHAKAYSGADRPIEYRAAEGAALRDESDISGRRLAPEKGRIQIQGRPHKTEAVWSHNTHPIFFPDPVDFAL